MQTKDSHLSFINFGISIDKGIDHNTLVIVQLIYSQRNHIHFTIVNSIQNSLLAQNCIHRRHKYW